MWSRDRILRIQQEQRQKAERDAFAYGEDKLRRGRREGREEGYKEALR